VELNRLGVPYTICSECLHSAGHCYCDTSGSGLSRQELNDIAVAIIFGYDLSTVKAEVVADVHETLTETEWAKQVFPH
jgi:hypothetical protein